MTTQDLSFACPQCRQMDMVQKVSAIVTAGTSRGRYSGPSVGLGETFGRGGGTTIMGGYTTLSGSSQSDLSRMLGAPPRPKKRRPSIGLRVFAGLLTVSIAAGAQSVFGGWGGQETPVAFLAVCFGASLAGALLALLWNSSESDRFEREELPVWQAAMDRWNKLFYCHRCDGVFVPGGTLLPSRQIGSLLHQGG